MKLRIIQQSKLFFKKRDITSTFRIFLCFLVMFFSGCGERVVSPSIALSLSGPALAIVGEYNHIAIAGRMDRTCMVGVGNIALHSEQKESDFLCEGKVNTEPSEKGRVRGILDCSGGQSLAFSLRNLGPDQGVGIAKPLDGSAALMLLFYHSSTEEAKRRFPEVKAEIIEVNKNLMK